MLIVNVLDVEALLVLVVDVLVGAVVLALVLEVEVKVGHDVVGQWWV